MHEYNFVFEKGKYVNGMQIGNQHIDSIAVLPAVYYKFRQHAFSDRDVIPFAQFCAANPPLDLSDDHQRKHSQKRLGFQLINVKILQQLPWIMWPNMIALI